MHWKVGYGEVDITPPIGVWLTGFAARTKPCDDIHTPLSARALVVENEKEQRVAIVALDLIALTNEQVSQLRQLVSEWTGIAPELLLINCSHTHSGPAVGELAPSCMGRPDPTYLDLAIRKAATAVKLACDNLTQAQLRFGTALCSIGINRRQRTADGRTVIGQNPEGPTDPMVKVLVAEVNGFHCLLFSYACHPVVLGPDNYAVSADYVHFARQAVEDFFGGQAVALFLQGCAGNINPRERGTKEIAQRLGQELGASVVQAALKAEPLEGNTLEGITGVLKLPLLPPPSPKTLQEHQRKFEEQVKAAEREGRLSEVQWRQCEVEWSKRVRQALRQKALPSYEPLNAQLLRIGNLAFAGTASETFVEIGLAVQKGSPFDHTVPLGYTNGCIGYLPTAEAYEEGGYEVEQAFKFYGRLLMLAPQSESIVVDWLLRSLKRLYDNP